MKIEILFPELCSIYGDSGNVLFLKKSLKDAEIVETPYQSEPLFAKEDVDMIYIGSMTENSQVLAIKYLAPYKNRLKELIDKGVVVLATGNAMELFGEYIAEDESIQEALGLFPYNAKRKSEYFRHNSLFLGKFEDMEIVGCKSQFSFVYTDGTNPFAEVVGGYGNNPQEKTEGIRYKNFFGTYVLGPLLPLNPPFTKYILSIMGYEGKLAFEKEAMDAYEYRLKHLKQENMIYDIH